MDFDDWDRLYAEHRTPQEAAAQMKCSVSRAAECLKNAQHRRMDACRAQAKIDAKQWDFGGRSFAPGTVYDFLMIYGADGIMRGKSHIRQLREIHIPQSPV